MIQKACSFDNVYSTNIRGWYVFLILLRNLGLPDGINRTFEGYIVEMIFFATHFLITQFLTMVE